MNFSLSDEARYRIAELADAEGLPASRVLERLIMEGEAKPPPPAPRRRSRKPSR